MVVISIEYDTQFDSWISKLSGWFIRDNLFFNLVKTNIKLFLHEQSYICLDKIQVLKCIILHYLLMK